MGRTRNKPYIKRKRYKRKGGIGFADTFNRRRKENTTSPAKESMAELIARKLPWLQLRKDKGGAGKRGGHA